MYQIEFTKGATKQLNKIPVNNKNRIDSKILNLATEPRPKGVTKLNNEENTYRIRVG